MVIFCVPLNPTPLIVLKFSKAVAVVAFPLRLPLMNVLLLIFRPASKSLNPGTAFDVLIVNGELLMIPITIPPTVNCITGCSVPTLSNSVVLTALVVSNPSAVSGPTKIHSVPLYVYRTFELDFNQNEPVPGFVGAVSE